MRSIFESGKSLGVGAAAGYLDIGVVVGRRCHVCLAVCTLEYG